MNEWEGYLGCVCEWLLKGWVGVMASSSADPQPLLQTYLAMQRKQM